MKFKVLLVHRRDTVFNYSLLKEGFTNTKLNTITLVMFHKVRDYCTKCGREPPVS